MRFCRDRSLPDWFAECHSRIREPCHWQTCFGVNPANIAVSLPYNNHARSRLVFGNGNCFKCPQGEVGSPCWVLYGKPTPKQHYLNAFPFESLLDESTDSHGRESTFKSLLRPRRFGSSSRRLRRKGVLGYSNTANSVFIVFHSISIEYILILDIYEIG